MDINRPMCSNCGAKPAQKKGKNKDGSFQWKSKCWSCNTTVEQRAQKAEYQRKLKATKYGYTRKTFCEYCGFKALHPVQLSTDHIDGNNSNNNPSNLWTLCHNCHHLKSFMCKDWTNHSDEYITREEVEALMDDLVDPPVPAELTQIPKFSAYEGVSLSRMFTQSNH